MAEAVALFVFVDQEDETISVRQVQSMVLVDQVLKMARSKACMGGLRTAELTRWC